MRFTPPGRWPVASGGGRWPVACSRWAGSCPLPATAPPSDTAAPQTALALLLVRDAGGRVPRQLIEDLDLVHRSADVFHQTDPAACRHLLFRHAPVDLHGTDPRPRINPRVRERDLQFQGVVI